MKSTAGESGFSMVELMIALVVTTIVTGAMYGLMAGGQSAFRREPELIDRQQNIRNAMSMIEEDLRTAGFGMPAFTQVFTAGLDNLATTLPSIITPGERTDGLEFLAGDWNCPAIPLCAFDTAPDPMALKVPVDSVCLPRAGAPGLLLMTSVNDVRKPVPGIDASLIVGSASRVALAAAPAACVGAAQFTLFKNQGPAAWHPGLGGITRYMVLPVRAVKYQIAMDPAETNGLPKLWRSVTGGRTAASNYATSVAPGLDATWQIVAEGVEDLQVEYMSGPIVDPGPPVWDRRADADPRRQRTEPDAPYSGHAFRTRGNDGAGRTWARHRQRRGAARHR